MSDWEAMIDVEADAGSLRVREALTRHVRRLLHARNGWEEGRPQVVRVRLPVDVADPFSWLQAQPFAEKLYWAGRDEAAYVVAAGAADAIRLEAPADPAAVGRALEPVLNVRLGAARYYGGLRFDPGLASSPGWSSFGAVRFVLPRFEVHGGPDGTVLVCNLLLPRDRDRVRSLLRSVELLRFEDGTLAGDLPRPVGREDRPDRAAWRSNVVWALDGIEAGELEKVVLAREAAFQFEASVSRFLLLEKLAAATPHCFHFYLQFEEDVGFMGASPERLFRQEDRAVQSEAVAGTRPRGQSARDDARLREELLHSEKDRREHAYVHRSIVEALNGLCERVETGDGATEMKLARERHLVSTVGGTLQRGHTPLDVLRVLHPTPAVGGYPREPARAAIAAREPFDRGWYAGPVGWIGQHDADFAVAIRSGRIERERLVLYSGAGIVVGSEPEAEWEEIEHKLSDFINVLRLGRRRTKY